MSDIERVNEIEHLIATGKLSAAQVFTQMKQLLQAAREQEGMQPEGRVTIPRDAAEAKGMYLVGHSWLKHNAPGELSPLQPQGVPEGFVLAPKSMCIDQDDVGLIAMITGWDDEDQSDAEGVLWFGLIEDDEGNRTYGLNISCSECMEEGAIQLVQFDEPNSTPAAPQADEWVKCSERMPTEADEDACGQIWGWIENKGIGAKWVRMSASEIKDMSENKAGPICKYWKPTGLTRPQPPEQGDGV